MNTDQTQLIAEAGQNTPFGEQNRRRLIAEYFNKHGVPTTESAWVRVYGLLLWIDRTTGLAHCYESDKCQPGRSWYGRSLSFHRWLADALKTTSLELGKKLDWLFQNALEEYLKMISQERQVQKAKGERQRASFPGLNFPQPGTDSEIQSIISSVLKPYFKTRPPASVFDTVAERLREYWKQENKRKNLLGEGFEDVLAAVITAAVGAGIKARTRASIADIGRFYAPGEKDKANKVDLVVECSNWPRPALINVKWSIRADREDQLWDDFKEFVRFDRDHRGFDHFLVTNEFDPARLNAVCDRHEANNHVFKQVVHINTDGVLAAYSPLADAPPQAGDSSIERVRQQIQQGRLVSISKWLATLRANA